MTQVLTTRRDINLDSFFRVAWRGENVRISDEALERIAFCRASFLKLIDNDPTVVIYGVTTPNGELAKHRLSAEERDSHARMKPFPAATSFGDPLPDRVVRGIVFARLTNFLDGHAATTPRMAKAVAAMLDGGPMPEIAGSGQGGAGEIQALYPLFAELSTRFELEIKERSSLINGSPCAAAMVADSALAARRRVALAEKIFALSIEAFRAPLEHYDPVLDGYWGDEHETKALQNLRALLTGACEGRRSYQAPVSYRIVPRVLGHAHRALAAAEKAAEISLASISHNPVYIPPDGKRPYGRCISTGGYHNSMASPALDDLATIWVDIATLCDRQATKLLNGKISDLPDMLMVGRRPCESDGRGHVGYVALAINGYLEQIRSAAQSTFIPAGESAASGQDDVATPTFLAFGKEQRAGRYLDAVLSMLAVVASQAFYVSDRQAPPALRGFVDMVRAVVPPLHDDRVLGPELGRLADRITHYVFGDDDAIDVPAPAKAVLRSV